MNKLTIQINNLEALERLIGGQNEVEIDIRNAVVQKFAEKHLKPLANCPEITTTLAAIKDNIAMQVKEKCEKEVATFRSSWSGITDVKLNPSIRAEIDSQVRNIVDTTIRNTVDESIKTWYNEETLKSVIDKKIDYYANDFINREIKARLEKLKSSF